MQAEGTDDPLRTMRVDRVTRSDGRYLVYYEWPADGGEAPEEEGPQETDDV